MNKKFPADELEKIIEALQRGQKPEGNKELIQVIKSLMKDLESIKIDKNFYEELKERLEARAELVGAPLVGAQKTWWQNILQFTKHYKTEFGLVFSGVFVLSLGAYFYELNFQEPKILKPNPGSDTEFLNQTRVLDTQEKKQIAVAPVPNPGSDSESNLRTRVVIEDKVEMDMATDMAAPAGLRAWPHPEPIPPIEPPIWPAPKPRTIIENRENYAELEENSLKRVTAEPISTFSIDVDTGSYANVRRFLTEGELPPKEAVRVEEMINYFSYDYPTSNDKNIPFSVTTEVAPAPWNKKTKLLHVGIKGYESNGKKRNYIGTPERCEMLGIWNCKEGGINFYDDTGCGCEYESSIQKASNLVFLLDVSGSMEDKNKLPLLKKSLLMLSRDLSAKDKISIITYAGSTGLVLDGVEGNNSIEIERALDRLSAGGSTNGGAGIELAYATAEKYFIDGGINRILLATDGDFNVGITNFEALKKRAEEKRETGISLTTLGFGTGNYNDKLMEQLADSGNGNYAYIDSLLEAQKVLVAERGATLETIAKDIKIQIEFNPAVVSEYRLIGYENRILRAEDFNNDKIDAGEIGAGHTGTALYEIALVGEGGTQLPELRYQEKQPVPMDPEMSDEIAFLKIRHKAPQGSVSELNIYPIKKSQIKNNLEETSNNFKFSASVAAFGQKLRGSRYLNDFSYDDIRDLANEGKGADAHGYRAEFIRLVELAKSL